MKNIYQSILSILLISLAFPALSFDGMAISDYREGTRLDSNNRPYQFVYEWFGVSNNGLPLIELTPDQAMTALTIGTPTQCTVSFMMYSSGPYAHADPVFTNPPAGMTNQSQDNTFGGWSTVYLFARNNDCLTALNELGVTYGFFNSNVKNKMNSGGTIGGNSCLTVRDIRANNIRISMEGLGGCAYETPVTPVSCVIDSPMIINYGIIRNTDLSESRMDNTINISCQENQNTVLFSVNPNPIEMGSRLFVKPELCVGNSCESMKTVKFKGTSSLILRTTLQSDNNNPPEGGEYQAHIILSAQYY